ncbi:MAG: hypothetical protein FK733_08895 [Asgard group archaeon]|nr:hypothetical protein [Asgard group archaeon]
MTEILFEFTRIFQKWNKLSEIYHSLNTLLREKFDYKFTTIYISDKNGKFSLGIKTEFDEPFQEELDQSNELITIFNNQKPIEIDEISKKIFFKVDFNHTGILVPLVSRKYLYGIIGIGMNKPYDFSNDLEKLTSIGQIISALLCSALKYNKLKLHNEYLQEISSKVRHDLRNHLQIIGLSRDILKDTNLTEEQIGYLEKIGKGLAKASAVINEQIKMKTKFNEEIDEPIGLPLP